MSNVTCLRHALSISQDINKALTELDSTTANAIDAAKAAGSDRRRVARARPRTNPQYGEGMAAFIAQVGHESGQLTRMVENLNYSADRLRAVWPNRFDAALATQVARKPEQIANIVYGSRMGNMLPGDGWKYRGRGLIQLTGANNYRAAGSGLGLDLINHPELLEQSATAALVAGWFWQSNGLNELADSEQFAKITRTINGGLTGHAERVALRDLAAKVLA